MVSSTLYIFALAVVQLAFLSTASAACVPLASPLLNTVISPCAPSVYPGAAPYVASAPIVIRDSSVANGLVDVMQLMVASDLMQNNLGPYLPICAPIPQCGHLPACSCSTYAPYYPYYL